MIDLAHKNGAGLFRSNYERFLRYGRNDSNKAVHSKISSIRVSGPTITHYALLIPAMFYRTARTFHLN